MRVLQESKDFIVKLVEIHETKHTVYLILDYDITNNSMLNY